MTVELSQVGCAFLPEPAIPWDALEVDSAKRLLYADDPAFRLGWVQAVAGAGARSVAWEMRRLGLVVLKPEVVASRRCTEVIEALRTRGYGVVGAWAFEMTWATSSMLWQYQLATATSNRLVLGALIWRQAPCVALLVSGTDMTEDDAPTSRRLGAEKGRREGGRWTAGSLRDHLDAPNRMLSLVHVADEPADLVRELSILSDGVTPWHGRLSDSSLERLVGAVESGVPYHDLCAPEAFRRLAENGHRFGESPLSAAAAGELEQLLNQALISRAAPCWDLILAGTELLEQDRPGVDRVL